MQFIRLRTMIQVNGAMLGLDNTGIFLSYHYFSQCYHHQLELWEESLCQWNRRVDYWVIGSSLVGLLTPLMQSFPDPASVYNRPGLGKCCLHPSFLQWEKRQRRRNRLVTFPEDINCLQRARKRPRHSFTQLICSLTHSLGS